MGRSLSMEQVATSLFITPSLVDPMLAPVRALRHELLFCVLFLSTILHKTLGARVLMFWAVASGYQTILSIIGPPASKKIIYAKSRSNHLRFALALISAGSDPSAQYSSRMAQ